MFVKSLKKLGNGLIGTAKNSLDFAQGKTSIIKSYYNLGEKVLEAYKNGELTVSKELENDIKSLMKKIEESDIEILDNDVLDSINELKEQTKKSTEVKTETKLENDNNAEVKIEEVEIKEVKEVKETNTPNKDKK